MNVTNVFKKSVQEAAVYQSFSLKSFKVTAMRSMSETVSMN